ncbi:MAG: AGE family epimerase/isomerase, partial [Eudoraea sp.]|nr:AGE family epimerase/isomerase [Eudoraea sp.]
MKKLTSFLLISMTIAGVAQSDKKIISEFENAISENLLKKWYPLAVDHKFGGFYSDITRDFSIGERQNKMIVSQARHIWTTAKASEMYVDNKDFKEYARHGFEFLRDHMWDSIHGGFYNLVSRSGVPIPDKDEPKTAYGNA